MYLEFKASSREVFQLFSSDRMYISEASLAMLISIKVKTLCSRSIYERTLMQ
jgi:hypothetical protein